MAGFGNTYFFLFLWKKLFWYVHSEQRRKLLIKRRFWRLEMDTEFSGVTKFLLTFFSCSRKIELHGHSIHKMMSQASVSCCWTEQYLNDSFPLSHSKAYWDHHPQLKWHSSLLHFELLNDVAFISHTRMTLCHQVDIPQLPTVKLLSQVCKRISFVWRQRGRFLDPS